MKTLGKTILPKRRVIAPQHLIESKQEIASLTKDMEFTMSLCQTMIDVYKRQVLPFEQAQVAFFYKLP